MIASRRTFLFASTAALAGGCSPSAARPRPATAAAEAAFASSPFRALTDAQWRARLTPAAYAVLRREDTERPGSSPLEDEHRSGTYVCAGCDLPLFQSDWKYESGSGWPSFWEIMNRNIGMKRDLVIGYPRTEYHCARCLGHQGHVFDDGPRPTGLRYCNNGLALRFIAAA
ncbi:MAG: peptide-methionine (R)-S-oxide reductase MsrB [Hyphomonadaceae bacterium]|nr:MAG: peptide-methionine (R)-S-oxide reductase [Caulobacteraceae bacterium]MBT9445465.1 peptide-methionine (R)-S-oxide reductase MsrB [Hyphomonadaceae bacterium]TPW03418.1 MAG: peptide-methionine (R)-S-oxide reductase [Alphaproteobacteria bacterium]